MAQDLKHRPDSGTQKYDFIAWTKTLAILAILVVGMAGLAGRWDWWTGWIFLGIFALYCLVLFVWLSSTDPDLARQRQQDADQRNQPYERVIVPVMIALELALLIVVVLDNGRFGWSNVPLAGRVIGGILVVLTGIMLPWVFQTNTFASGVGRIQDDRGHHVITSGPYRFVRHPMYAAVIAGFIGLPLVLGSWWGLIPGILLALLFLVRTALEDRMLTRELPGYYGYSRRTRFRIIPGIW